MIFALIMYLEHVLLFLTRSIPPNLSRHFLTMHTPFSIRLPFYLSIQALPLHNGIFKKLPAL